MIDVYDWINREVQKLSEERSVSKNRAFQAWCLYFTQIDIELDEAFVNTDTLRGHGGGDGGVDGWYVDDENREFHIWQCKLPDSYVTAVFDTEPYKELRSAFEALLDEKQAAVYGDKFVEISTNLINCIDHGYSVVLNIGIAGIVKTDSIEKIEKLFSILQSDFCNRFADSNLSLEIWDLNRFEEQSELCIPTYETLEGHIVEFKLQNSEIIQLNTGDSTLPENWEAVIVTLNGKSLAEKAILHGSKLFSLNVRFALGANRRIQNLRNSLTKPDLSKFFWLYNNGITIVSDEIELVKQGDEGHQKYVSIKITNPQVVNGCQTVTAFKKNKGKIAGNPSVLARIIKAPNNEIGRDQASKIAEYTNSQTPVLTRDLKSKDPIQKTIKAKFYNLEPKWFYEVKRGEWDTLKVPEKDVFKAPDGKYRRIDIEKVGKAWRMVLGEPAAALDKKKDLFEDDAVYNQVFSKIPAENYLFSYKLYSVYDSFWHGSNFDGIRIHSGLYMDDELLRRMMQQKGLIVAYSVSVFSHFIRIGEVITIEDSRYGLYLLDNFDTHFKAWNKVMIKSFYDIITNIPDISNIKKEFLDRGTLKKLIDKIYANASLRDVDNVHDLFPGQSL